MKTRSSTSTLRLSTVQAAFTLLEVLVALAIFAIAAVVLGAAYVNVLTAYATIEPRSEFDADVKFVRAALLAQPDRKKVERGDSVDLQEGRQAHWDATIDDTSIPDLFRVTFTCEINGQDLSKPFKVAQTFLLLRPGWSDPTTRAKLHEATQKRILDLLKK